MLQLLPRLAIHITLSFTYVAAGCACQQGDHPEAAEDDETNHEDLEESAMESQHQERSIPIVCTYKMWLHVSHEP